MQPTVPVPTDNVYKFVCLFGLAIFIASLIGSVYYARHVIELLWKYELELITLDEKESLSPVEIKQKNRLEQHLERIRNDKKLASSLFVPSMLGSLMLALIGFLLWIIKVQPKQDRLINL